jgi:hypothetical protein
MDAAKIGGKTARSSDPAPISRWNAGLSTEERVSSNLFFISGKTKVQTTFGREEPQPHFDKNSQASPGPSERYSRKKYDSRAKPLPEFFSNLLECFLETGVRPPGLRSSASPRFFSEPCDQLSLSDFGIIQTAQKDKLVILIKRTVAMV